MKRKHLGITLTLLILALYCSGAVLADTATVVSISPGTQTISPGQIFTVNVTVDPAVPIAGVQFDLSFDPSLISANGVTEGNLLNQGGASTYFSPGTIDNSAGTITGVAGAITTPGQTVSSPGTFAIISFTAKTMTGTSPLNLSNVIAGDIGGAAVPVTVNNGNVNISCENSPPVAAGLATILDKLVLAYGFKQGEGQAGWTIYNPAWASSHPDWNTLTTLYRGRGYWIRVSQDCNLVYGSNTYHLDAGWNLIGWCGC